MMGALDSLSDTDRQHIKIDYQKYSEFSSAAEGVKLAAMLSAGCWAFLAVRAAQHAPTSELIFVAAVGGATFQQLWQYAQYRLEMRKLAKRWSDRGCSIYYGDA